jgi:hypothetical protein
VSWPYRLAARSGQPAEQGLHGLAHDVEAVGAGHIGPLPQAAPDVVTLVTAFWRDPQATISRHRTQESSPAG